MENVLLAKGSGDYGKYATTIQMFNGMSPVLTEYNKYNEYNGYLWAMCQRHTARRLTLRGSMITAGEIDWRRSRELLKWKKRLSGLGRPRMIS